MTSERTRKRIARLLDEAEAASDRGDWQRVIELGEKALAFDPGNSDALDFITGARRALSRLESETATAAKGAESAAASSEPSAFAGGRYRVKTLLGEGGKKKVYLAHDTLLDRDVAFALIKTEGLDDAARQRVMREAQVMARLGDHPNINTIYDLGLHESQPYMVLPVMLGGDLEGLIEKSPDRRLPVARVIEIGEQVCRGLEFAHTRGVVHRDLKPGNVWLAEPENFVVKIGDFGLALTVDRTRLTQHGMMVGTVAYMPPEQALGGDVSAKADLYSLGAMLYEMVTGRPPFIGSDPVSVISQHVNATPVAPTWHNQNCPPPLEALILRLLAKDPAKRPESAAIVRAALTAIDTTAPDRPKSSDHAASNTLDSVQPGVFVGRRQEIADLRSAVDEAASGRGSLVMVVGEPGIGKTRTVTELATYAGLRQVQVLWGRCYEAPGAPPYWPWIQAIRASVRARDPVQLRAELGSGAADIAEIVSDIRERLPDLSNGPRLDNAEQARFRLFDSICSFLGNSSRRQPQMIVLDDLHWADRPSLLLLEFLAREVPATRLLIVGTYRDVELSRQHPLAQTLGELARERRFKRVVLRGLTAGDVRQYIDQSTGIDAPEGLVTSVHSQTEGNALFVTEVVRLLVQEGDLKPERLSRRTSWTVRIPDGIREAIGRRLNRLSPECNSLLTTAAVIGRQFEIDLLRKVIEALPEERLVAAIDEALGSRVIEELPPAPGRYQFTHALIQETLAREVSSIRRVAMHRRIAEALEEITRAKPGPHLAELAHHFAEAARGGTAGKAIHYCVEAGNHAMQVLAYEEAVAHFDVALQVIALEPGTEAETSRRVLMAMAEVQRRAGLLSDSLVTFRNAFDQAVEAGDREMAASAAIGYEDAEFLTGAPRSGLDDPSIRLLRKVLDDAEGLSAPVRSEVTACLARALYFAGSRDEADDLSSQAVEIARTSTAERDGRSLAQALHARRIVLWGPDRLDQRLAITKDLIDVAERSGAMELSLDGRLWRIYALLESGDMREVDVQIQEYSASADRLRQPSLLYYTHLLLAMRDLQAGRFDDAERVMEEALRLGRRAQSQNAEWFHTAQRYSLLRDRGGLAELVGRVEDLARQVPGILTWRCVLTAIHAEIGDHASAASELDQLAARGFRDLPRDHLWLRNLASIAVACAALGDAARAALVYELLRPHEGQVDGDLATWNGPVARTLGMLASVMALRDEAIQHFERSIEACERMGTPPWLAYSQFEYGSMLLNGGKPEDRARAMALLDRSLDIARRLGMRPLMSKVLARKEILKA